MAERTKRLEKGVESLKEEIEKHFEKLEKDISIGDLDAGRYHIKEIDRSLIDALEVKLKILGTDDGSVMIYRRRLDELRKRVEGD